MSDAHTSEKPDDEKGVSMVDILEEEERLEADANAVLGDSDDKNCTYPRGYVNRQALYACNTCSAGNKEPGGICLACSYECHEGHDLIELYTKRFFRCDCGNTKFSSLKCKLYPEKDAVNISNKYNHNFDGLYCTCQKPYPDPDDEVEDEMIQCVVCEDWFHGRHLSTPYNQDYSEVVCGGCMKKHDFLWAYTQTSPVTVIKKEESNSEVDVVQSESANSESTDSKSETIYTNSSVSVGSSSQTSYASTASASTSTAEESTSGTSTGCLLKDLKARKTLVKKECMFWPSGWRKKLCRCPNCMTMYKDVEVLFLIDELDTVEAYEERGRQKNAPVSQHTKEVNALSQMNRIQQIEVLQGFNDLKSELSDYLKKFAENGKVVREEDIKEFFSGLEARKKKKTNSGVQFNCK